MPTSKTDETSYSNFHNVKKTILCLKAKQYISAFIYQMNLWIYHHKVEIASDVEIYSSKR